MLLGDSRRKPEYTGIDKPTHVSENLGGDGKQGVLAWLKEAAEYQAICTTELKPIIRKAQIYEAFVEGCTCEANRPNQQHKSRDAACTAEQENAGAEYQNGQKQAGRGVEAVHKAEQKWKPQYDEREDSRERRQG